VVVATEAPEDLLGEPQETLLKVFVTKTINVGDDLLTNYGPAFWKKII
jgi:hypothetical protein